MPFRALFLVNPRARGGSEGAEEIAARLRVLGLANNLARTLGIPLDPEGAGKVIAGGHRRRIDLGWVNDRYFRTTASYGLSVQITEELSPEVKRRWGPIAYALTAIKVIRRSHPFRAEISWEGGTRHTRTDLYSLEVFAPVSGAS